MLCNCCAESVTFMCMWAGPVEHKLFSDTYPLCLQVVSSRLLMTQGLLQKTAEEQGESEAIGDKLCKKAVSLMDDIAELAERYNITAVQ